MPRSRQAAPEREARPLARPRVSALLVSAVFVSAALVSAAHATTPRATMAHATMAHASVAASPESAPRADEIARALAIDAELQRQAAERALWPGFDPLAIPLAVFTGQQTVLFRHPQPPPEFVPLTRAAGDTAGGEASARVGETAGGEASARAGGTAGGSAGGTAPPVCACPGRHAAVTSNSSAELGGRMTATLRADARPDATAASLAATALHEAFHVFQREQHPGWSGNEGDLFLYPVDDVQLLVLRRLESEALRRALAEPTPERAAALALLALEQRRQRFRRLDAAFVSYERLTELNEGLATYVQRRAEGCTSVELPEQEFAPAAVRERTYAVGPALAFLLDRFRPGWQETLQADDSQLLDVLLAGALVASAGQGLVPVDFSAAERADAQAAAEADVAAALAARVARRQAFDALPGWRVEIVAAAGRPLWPQGFDPLNVLLVEGGVLHTRMLALGHDGGEVSFVDAGDADLEALSEGAGRHPLFEGVARLTVAGLAEPQVEQRAGELRLEAPGFQARLRGAELQTFDRRLVVRLP